VQVDFEVLPDELGSIAQPKPALSMRQRRREVEKHPLVKEAIEMFEAEITSVTPPRSSETAESTSGEE
jgi:hypothetical protein